MSQIDRTLVAAVALSPGRLNQVETAFGVGANPDLLVPLLCRSGEQSGRLTRPSVDTATAAAPSSAEHSTLAR